MLDKTQQCGNQPVDVFSLYVNDCISFNDIYVSVWSFDESVAVALVIGLQIPMIWLILLSYNIAMHVSDEHIENVPPVSCLF